MSRCRCTKLLLLGLLLCACLSLALRPQSVSAQAQPLRVAIKPLAPFVMKNGTVLRGFSIDLWEKIAAELGVAFQFVEKETVNEVLAAVTSSEADVGIAGITITAEREQALDFSLPMFDAGLAILMREQNDLGLSDAFETLVSSGIVQILLFILVLMVIVAHLIWLMERNRTPDFPTAYLPGVFEGFWIAANHLTTVGYGERTPRGLIGRVFSIIMIFVGIVLVAQFTAYVTSGLTFRQLRSSITGVSDLYGKPVATVANTFAADYLDSIKLETVKTKSIDDAYALLNAHQVSAIVFDAPVLAYYAVTEGRGRFKVVGDTFARQYYGIALPTASPLREQINVALLKLHESGEYNDIFSKWFKPQLN